MSGRPDTALGDYLRQIRDFNLLTAEEERELGAKIRAAAESEERFAQGEMSLEEYRALHAEAAQARDRMIQANLRLVISVAKHFRHRGLPLEDLVNEGNVGLMYAVDRFDPKMGSRFSTYASFWIDQALRRAVQGAGQMIHIPSYLLEEISQLHAAVRALEEQLGRPPNMAELAEDMKITPKKVQVIREAIRAWARPASGDGENALEQALPDRRTPQPFDGVCNESDAVFVSQMLERITEREALVLKLRYGLSERKGKPMTLKEIGDEVGLTRERVRQIEHEAKRKLVEYVKEYM